MNAREQGLFHKFNVTRTDGRHAPGEKHHGCEYFVLDVTHDAFAIPALAAYAGACRDTYPVLADDLDRKVAGIVLADSEFVTIPEVTLPDGTVVPSFQAAKFLSGRGPGDIPVSVAGATPWVRIDYHEAREAARRAGLRVLTESRALAIAWDAAQQDINWTGGRVGEGSLFMGLHKGTASSAQPGTYESSDPEERRWLQLSNGERIYDVAGNAFSWVEDDLHGDEKGLVARRIETGSASLQAPHPSRTKGMGWRPDGTVDWSGGALIRGGFWDSGSNAGAFYLNSDWPDYRSDYVGFRCTK